MLLPKFSLLLLKELKKLFFTSRGTPFHTVDFISVILINFVLFIFILSKHLHEAYFCYSHTGSTQSCASGHVRFPAWQCSAAEPHSRSGQRAGRCRARSPGRTEREQQQQQQGVRKAPQQPRLGPRFPRPPGRLLTPAPFKLAEPRGAQNCTGLGQAPRPREAASPPARSSR